MTRRLALLFLLLAAPQERRGAVPPEEALRTIRVPDGFEVRLAACEPLIADPVAVAFDQAGRLYVAEMRDYPLGPPGGRISLLEDPDGMGRFRKSTVFADGLSFPTSVLPWRDGLFVTVAYEVLYLRDADGDGKADERKTVFSGFGRQNSQHILNGLQLGLDGWIYGAGGLSGGTVGEVSIHGTDFRFHPDTRRFEPVSGRSQFGTAFDDLGRRFTVRHDNHCVYPVFAWRYLKRHAHLAVGAVEDSVSDHGNIPKLFPVSPKDSVFTTDTDSSCGIAWWSDGLMVCEPVLNLVHRDLIEESGGTFVARRAAKDAEFFASTDPWCRPVNCAVGPHGSLFVVDMYRAVIEHPDYIPKEIQKKLDFRGGTDRGRIWRVAPNSRLDWSVPDVARRGGRDLALSLRDGDAWVRATARRLILERRPPEAAAALRSLALDPASPPVARVQSLRTLEALGELGDDEVLAALRSRDAALRETALQLSEPRLPGSPALQEAARALEADPDRRVRFQLALTLGEIDAIDLLARIAARDPSDRWTRTAVLLSGAHRPVALLEGLVGAGSEGMARAGVLELVRSLSDVVARRKDPKEIEGWLRAVVAGDPPSRWRREALGILPALRRAGIDPAPHAERAGVSDLLNGWLAAALRTSLDGKAEAARRVEALETLAPIAESAHAESLFGLLGFREPQEVRVAAARILALQPGESAGGRLLDEWPTSTPGVRAEILRAFLGRADRVRQLLERIEQGRIGARDLAPEQRDALQRHPDPALRDRARKLFARQVSGDREEVIREVSAKLAKVAGDRVRGEKVYVASCATCHRLRGVGTKVGPDLEAAAGRDRKALLLDLLDPNRAMDPSYQVYVARTAANEMVYGVISAETPASVTLRRAAGEETTLLRKDIAELKAWPASLMPEGLETSLTGQDFADLLEFLGPAR